MRSADHSCGRSLYSNPACLAVSNLGAAAGHRHQQFRGRERTGGGVRGYHPARAADQWCRGHALHHLDQFERRHQQHQRNLSHRVRSEHRGGRRAEPRGHGAGPAAAGNQEHRRDHHQGQSKLRVCRRILLARQQSFQPIHFELPGRLRQRRTEAHSRRRRCR